ncbi:MAG: hypothetical protein KF911_12100 [Pseudomonadales bacterium]|nr:hypothetical protein [Pseudomonadales bacterium]
MLIPVGALLHRSWLYANPLQNALHMLPVYLLGMLASRYASEVLALCQRYGHALLLLTGILIAIELSLDRGGHIMSDAFSFEHGVVDWNYLHKAVLSVWLLGFMYQVNGTLQRWEGFYAFLSRVADLSFGIFFLHIYLNLFILPRLIDFPELNWPGYLLVTPLYFLVAYGITEVAKRVTGRYSRRLIGC